jgi:hypothetical protein
MGQPARRESPEVSGTATGRDSATAMLCSCHPGVIATLFFSGTKSNSGNSFYVIDTKRHALVGGPFKSRIRAQHRADELERRVPHG